MQERDSLHWSLVRLFNANEGRYRPMKPLMPLKNPTHKSSFGRGKITQDEKTQKQQ